MKTVSIIGNRPQLMKLIPELGDVVLWTGQHYDEALSGAHTRQLEKCGEVITFNDRPNLRWMIDSACDWLAHHREDIELVTVYGDTSSTLAGAIAAKNAKRTLIHVEAGLRCGNELLPEERNRIVVDALCDHAFCPSNEAIRHVPKGYCPHAEVVGDIMQERLYETYIGVMGKQLPAQKNRKWIVT